MDLFLQFLFVMALLLAVIVSLFIIYVTLAFNSEHLEERRITINNILKILSATTIVLSGVICVIMYNVYKHDANNGDHNTQTYAFNPETSSLDPYNLQ